MQALTGLSGLSGLVQSDPLAGLRVGAISSWRLQEASGTALDSVGTNTLTANNSPSTAAGPGSFQARSLVLASSQYFSIASNASLAVANTDWTLAGWVYLTSKAAAAGIVCKATFATGFGGYFLYYASATDRFRIGIGSAGATQEVSATTFGSPSTGTWYFLCARQNTTANTLSLSVNNGTADSAARTLTPTDGGNALNLGRFPDAAKLLDGRLANWVLAGRVWSAAEVTQAYNAGVGVSL